MRSAFGLFAVISLAMACEVPSFELYRGVDPAAVIKSNGYQIIEAEWVPGWAFTDCLTGTVWVRPDNPDLDVVLAHESFHVYQAVTLGCSRFLARYAADPGPFELDAYVEEFYYADCARRDTVLNAIENDSPEIDLDEARERLDPNLCD